MSKYSHTASREPMYACYSWVGSSQVKAIEVRYWRLSAACQKPSVEIFGFNRDEDSIAELLLWIAGYGRKISVETGPAPPGSAL